MTAEDPRSAWADVNDGRASFLDDPEVDVHVARMYTSDVSGQGYVAHLTRVWANSPEAMGAISYVLKNASIIAGLDARTRALLVTASAATAPSSPARRATTWRPRFSWTSTLPSCRPRSAPS
jgi:hypothetical protein